jgi:hypothetical protein
MYSRRMMLVNFNRPNLLKVAGVNEKVHCLSDGCGRNNWDDNQARLGYAGFASLHGQF